MEPYTARLDPQPGEMLPAGPPSEILQSSTGLAHDFGLQSFLAQADPIILGVLLILVLMSIATWYLVLQKCIENCTLRRRARRVVKDFWTARSLPQAIANLDGRACTDVYTELVMRGLGSDAHYREHPPRNLGEVCSHSEFVTRALRQSIELATARLERGLTVLASIGSTAPFVGLFGTVWGIYHALVRIGVSGQATLDQVAGPVGEALIMTAFGLAVAIPAVLAYNAFVRANRMLLAHLDSFAHDLHAYLTTGARIESGPRSVAGAGENGATALRVPSELSA
jgi:biopolymer transport protein ExbB